MRNRVLSFIPVLITAFCLVTSCQTKSKRDVFIITDIGTDVDDALAVCLAINEPQLNIIGIACTGTDCKLRSTIARNLLSMLDRSDIAIGQTAAFIDSTISNNPDSCDIILLSQATILSQALKENSALTDKIRRIYFQGLAYKDSSNIMQPDPKSFNVSEDFQAAKELFNFQYVTPFTIVGKYAAYPFALSRATFNKYAETGEPAGAFIKQEAVDGIKKFAHDYPERFRKVYNVASDISIDDALDNLVMISNPCDGITVLALTNPECFTPVEWGNHHIIGVLEYYNGINSSNCNILHEKLETLFLSLHAKKNH